MDTASRPLPPQPAVMDAKELSALLGLTEATLWGWVADGRVPPPIRKGRRYTRWLRSEIDSWFRAGCPDADAWQSCGG